MLSAISRRNAVLHCAASSNVRGGTKRVLVRPAIDALAITAIPQVGIAALSISATAVRMTPPVPRHPSTYLGWCGGIGKSNSCRLASVLIGGKGRQRRSAHGHVNAPLRTWFHCLRSLRQYRAGREVTQPSNLARVRRL